jgi:hypothetical protein
MYDFKNLQHTIGNQAVLRLRQSGKGADSYEQEADRLSEQVMRASEPQPHSACPCGGGCPGCRAEQLGQEQTRLQTKRVQASDTEQNAVPPIVNEVSHSSGQPLESTTRDLMESRFGHDFSNVRIHTSAQANDAARSVKALAYTTGGNIVFREGQYAPHTWAGRKLIAHELTHVIQQSGGGAPALQRHEESGEGREGGEAGPVGEFLCSVMPNSWVVGAVRRFFLIYPRALAHLDHYLAGSGRDYQEDIAALFRNNPSIATRIGQLIEESGSRSGTFSGTGQEGDGQPPPIRQADYNSESWRLSLGNVDEVSYEILTEPDASGNAQVRISIRDPYEWHPAEARDTQCLHRVMEAQKTERGARDYTSVGSATVTLRVGNQLRPR